MADEYRILFLPEASDDLRRIFDYIEKDSPQAAVRVVMRILDKIDSLQHLPHRCRVHRSSDRPSRVIRSMPIPPYIVYYRIKQRETLVEVLTVRHGARRQPRRFK